MRRTIRYNRLKDRIEKAEREGDERKRGRLIRRLDRYSKRKIVF